MLALAPAVLAPFEHQVHSLVHELPPPKPVAVVHVGPPKTGSTTLQSVPEGPPVSPLTLQK